jgi:hypothetical protein
MTVAARRVFLSAPDPLDPAPDLPGVRQPIRTSPVFLSWCNHLPGTFLVTSDHDPDRITDCLRQVTGAANFLVSRVDPEMSDCWLPPRSREWIRRRNETPIMSFNDPAAEHQS